MKKELSPGIILAIVAVVVLMMAFFGWRTFGPSSSQEMTSQQKQQARAARARESAEP
ncbi:MAG TPA: hypothetical protein VFB21_20110 [Chthonomonadaceae bacterium]|nr:hypothetical protein [Chthonomonadaceae bacterium]